MKKKYFLIVLFLILGSLLISGCSLIFGPSGSIYVDTYPSGAKVFLNGNDTGKITPCTITNLKKGTYEITVTLSDLSHTEKVIVYSGITTSVYKDLLTRLSKIIVQPPFMNLKEGEFQTIDSVTAYYFDSAPADIKLSTCSYSSNSNHATVSSIGTITGVSKGSAIITVSYTDVEITKTDTIIITVSEAEAPTAVINTIPPSPPTGIAPFEVYFDAYESYVDPECGFGCEIVSYKWDFGDGYAGIGITTNHTYSNIGSYTVILGVTDNNGKKGYDNLEIIVTKKPTAKITTEPPAEDGVVTGNFPFKVYFDAYQSTSESGIVSYEWEFGDNSDDGIGDGITVNHTYSIAGVYIVYLTITDSNRYEAYDSVSVIVTEPH